jgi:hypothetical protein
MGFVADRADITVGAEATNVINVAVQTRIGPVAPDVLQPIRAYLSTDAAGQTLASAPSGGIAIGTDGTILVEEVANVVLSAVTEADGSIDFDLTEASTGTWYLNVILPNGKVVTSDAITFA